MSQRFYINGYQPFSNGDLPKYTKKELLKQGIKIDLKELTIKKQKIKDIQNFLVAVHKDAMSYLLKGMRQKGQKFKDVKDIDFIQNPYMETWLKSILFDKKGRPNIEKYNILSMSENNDTVYPWQWLESFIQEKALFTSYNVFQAVKDCIVRKNNIYVIKSHRNIYVEMF